MEDIDIAVSTEHLTNQTQRLQEEFDCSLYESEELYSRIRLRVVNEMKTRNKEWTSTVIDSITNLLIHTQIETAQQLEDVSEDRIPELLENVLAD